MCDEALYSLHEYGHFDGRKATKCYRVLYAEMDWIGTEHWTTLKIVYERMLNTEYWTLLNSEQRATEPFRFKQTI